MSEHAKYSPSSLSRVAACPGSVAHCAGRSSPESEYALEGRRAHYLAERALQHDGELRKGMKLFKEGIFGGDPANPFCPPDEMIDAIGVYVNHVRGLTAEVKRYEERVKVREDLWGTADALAWEELGTLYVVDFKYGAGLPVAAVGNLQLASYALGALNALEDVPILGLEIHVVQPRSGDGDVKKWVIDEVPTWREEWTKRIEAIVSAAEAPNAPKTPGEHCRFCPGILDCPETTRLAKAANTLMTDDRIQGNLEKTATNTLLEFHEKGPAVKIFLNRVYDELLRRATAGVEIERHKLVDKVGNLAWKVDEKEVAKHLKSLGLKSKDFEVKKLKTPTQLKKVLGESLSDFADRPHRGVELVHESDKRPVARSTEELDDVLD